MTRVALTLHDGAVDAVLAGSYHASLRRARQSGGQPVRDLTTVRQFLNTPSTLAFFDAPWAPVFLSAVFLLHPWLGVLALLSTGVLLGLGILTETHSRGPYRRATEQAAEAQRFAENGLRHADVLAAVVIQPLIRVPPFGSSRLARKVAEGRPFAKTAQVPALPSPGEWGS